MSCSSPSGHIGLGVASGGQKKLTFKLEHPKYVSGHPPCGTTDPGDQEFVNCRVAAFSERKQLVQIPKKRHRKDVPDSDFVKKIHVTGAILLQPAFHLVNDGVINVRNASPRAKQEPKVFAGVLNEHVGPSRSRDRVPVGSNHVIINIPPCRDDCGFGNYYN